MSDDPSTETAPDRAYRELRSELSYEASLILQRTAWFVTAQAFFFSSLAIAVDRSPDVPFSLKSSLLFPLIPILALFVSLTTLLSVWAGVDAANQVRRKIVHLKKYSELAKAFPERDFITLFLGLLPPVGMPIAFTIAWIYVLTTS